MATHAATSDIGCIWTISEQGGVPPWDDPSRYVERSPITYAKAIRTPLLLIHAESDFRCPVEQSEQLFVALKRLGREVVLGAVPRRKPRDGGAGPPTPPAGASPHRARLVRQAPRPECRRSPRRARIGADREERLGGYPSPLTTVMP